MLSKNVGEFQNQEAEKAVIYSLLTHHQQNKIHLPDIHEDFFFHPNYRKIFNAISDLTNNGEDVDLISIKKKLKNITSILTDIVSSTATSANIKTYIQILKDHADRRWFIHNCYQATQSKTATKEIMGKLSADIISRLRDRDREKPDVKNIISEFEKYQAENQQHIKSGNKFIGLESGFPTIDKAINGIRQGHYWIVSAYSNTGKSYFLLNIANRLLDQGKRILYFSLEMSRVQNIARLLGLKTKIDPTIIERGDNSDELLRMEIEAKGELYDQNLTLYTQKRSINDILVTIYAEHSASPIDCIMIDYIQKVQGNAADSRYERYTTSSDTIQKVSQELQIPVLVASQIDNQSARAKNTDIVATKGSGDIAGDVDFAVLLQRSEEQLGAVKCFIQKNRHGMKDGCQIKFYDGGNMHELDQHHDNN